MDEPIIGLIAFLAAPVVVIIMILVISALRAWLHVALWGPEPPKPFVWTGKTNGFGGWDPTYTKSQRYMELAVLAPEYTESVMRYFHGKDAVDAVLADAKLLEAKEAVQVLEPAAIPFREGEPATFDAMETHQHVAGQLRVLVGTMTRDHPAIKPLMLLGGAGRGKTTLVRVTANEIRLAMEAMGLLPGYLVEAYGDDLDSAAKLDQAVRQANSRPGSVLFIDEVHSMGKGLLERLYMMLDRDQRYKFDGDLAPTTLNPFTVAFATTDRGNLSEPLRTRCLLLDIEKVPQPQLFRVAMNQAFEVDPEAASLAVDRVKWDGSIRPLIGVLEMAHKYMQYRGGAVVGKQDVQDYLDAQQLDTWGLAPIDRAVVNALYDSARPAKVKKNEPPRLVYALSEATVTSMARLDKDGYREEVKPRLMDRGFLLSTSGGQQLTDAGVAYARTFVK